ncbi:MAG TPA: glycosyltransferase 87 family protein [Thermoleophilaceae bacterium]
MRRVCRLLICLALVVAAGPPAGAAAAAAPDAIAIAARAPEAAEYAGVAADAQQYAPDEWRVRWPRSGSARLEVDVDTRQRRVLATWTGDDVDYPMARGYPGFFGGKVNALWVWLPLCVLFVAPFVDPRRPLRVLHFDLLAILSLSVSLAFFNHGTTAVSVPLVYPPLVYLLVRAMPALRGRGLSPQGRLVPYASRRLLVAGLIAVLFLRAALNVLDVGDRSYVGYGTVGSHVVDVGLAGVAGADRIEHGQQLFTRGGGHLDTYGPLNYLAYVPFELVWPYRGDWDELPAAHVAALVFDLATVFLLLLIGRRMRPAREGSELGLALAYGWAACPWTAYVLMADTDDALVAAFVASALAAWSWPLLRGAMIGAGSAVKFAPAVLLPAGLAGGRRAALLALGGCAAVVLATTVPLIPDGGLRELYDATLGYQLGTSSPFSIWGRWAGFDVVQHVAQAAAVALTLVAAWMVWRRPGDPRLVAAAIAVALLAAQLTAIHWIYFYFVWALPPLLAALFAAFVDSPE